MKPITVFYHLFIPDLRNTWIWWVDEQLSSLKTSKLSDVAKVKICITLPLNVHGKVKRSDGFHHEQIFDQTVSNYIEERYPFVEVIDKRSIEDLNIFEGQTLYKVWKHSQDTDEYILYFHNKGISDNYLNQHGDLEGDKNWRHYMQYYCVSLWNNCVEKLKEYDCVGANYFEDFYPFAGNFWWATTEHIKKLPNPLDYDSYYDWKNEDDYNFKNPRFALERWIGYNKPNIFYLNTRKVRKQSSHINHDKKSMNNKKNLLVNERKQIQKYNLCRIVPDNEFSIHSQVFHEIEAGVYFTLKKMGYDVTNSINEFSTDARNIVFGMHQCPVDIVRHYVPKDTIVFSLEQMRDAPECIRWCRKYFGLEVWDYSTRNIEFLKTLGITNIKHCQIGYVPELTYFEQDDEKDIDILAYMSPSPRRTSILEQFNNKNINFVSVQSTYGEERDNLIKRSKLVINLHNHDNQIFEMVRVSHLIQNKVPVLAEINPNTDFPDYMEGTVFTSTYDNFVDTAMELLRQPQKLKEQTDKALDIFKKYPMEKFFKEVLN